VHAIRPERGWARLGLRELFEYRELLYFLTWRNLLIRYKQAALGAAWAILQPVFLMVVFTVFFGHIAKVGSEGYPYPIFSYAALLPWTLFSSSVGLAAVSLVSNSALLSKVYLPRLALPLSAVLSSIVDFLLALIVLFGLMAYYGTAPRASAIFLVPVLTLLAVLASLGLSFLLAALNVAYRDVAYVVPFFLQVLFFVTPVVYSARSLSGPWRTIYGLNPMVAVVEGFRYALLGAPGPSPGAVLASIFSIVALLALGLIVFRRMERNFADVI
jgi:lipopolysaccharide transport system permease protein